MRWVVPVVVAVSSTVIVPSARGQDVLSLAREALRAGQLDSAQVLLGRLTDSGSVAPRAQVVEAWILTGIARFYAGQDTGAATAFRRAFALDPSVHVDGLSQMDSTMGALFEAQRPAPVEGSPGRDSSVRADSVFDCRQHCPSGLSKPVLASFPQVDRTDAPVGESQTHPGAGGLGASGMHGVIVFQFVVTDGGTVDPATVRIVSSTARPWERLFSRPLLLARFRPARVGAQAVSAWVRLRVEIRAAGTEGFDYEFQGP
jgi:hypothetical protein